MFDLAIGQGIEMSKNGQFASAEKNDDKNWIATYCD
jgi:hypothetical protein